MKKALKNFPVRLKLITSHGIIALLAVFCAVIALIGIAGLIANLKTVHEDAMSSIAAAGELKFAAADVERSILEMLRADAAVSYDQKAKSVEQDMEDIRVAFTTLSTHLEGFCLTEDAKLSYQNLTQMFQESEPVRLQVMEHLKKGDISQAQAIYQASYQVSLSQLIAGCEQLMQQISDAADLYCVKALQQNNVGVMFIILMIVISLIMGVYLTHIVCDSIRLPVQQLMRASEEMKQGHLSVVESITYESNDEVGTLAASMRETLQFLSSYVEEIGRTLHHVANGDLTATEESITQFRGEFASIRESLIYIFNHMNDTLGNINLATEQVNMGAVQIASGAQALAQGAGEQAASIQQLSAAVTDISQKINTTAEHATTAMQTSRTTSEQAQVCNTQMQHMMDAMNELTEQASQISRIVKTIEDIAFQTNILALNAAVEAARAGNAGKGFAVVADEVRTLAAKSAEASQNTAVLIGATVDAVNNGTRILAETAQSLTGVVKDSQAASELAGEIAQAAAAQATAVTQISQNIEDISGVVNTNSSTAEESAAASEELSGQATMLRGMLEQFRLRSNG